MYAIVKTGGKQYRLEEGSKVRVEKLAGAVGDSVELSEVLMIGGDSPVLGAPLVAGASVKATIVSQGKGKKLRVFKRARRKGFKKTIGHRQLFTELKVTSISS